MYFDKPDRILFTPERAESMLTPNGGMKRAAINVLLGLPESAGGPTPPWRRQLTGTFIPRERYERAKAINQPPVLFPVGA